MNNVKLLHNLQFVSDDYFTELQNNTDCVF